MGKFKIKMKLTGFELEIEGSREDMPNIQQALASQLGGMLQPPSGILDNDPDSEVTPFKDITPPEQEKAAKKRKRKAAPAGPKNSMAAPNGSTPIEWPRDVATKYGVPNQAWPCSMKALWILYVAHEAAGEKELTANRIAETFNLHYRQAKEIKVGNVKRDLGALKIKPSAWVAEDATKSPSAWYLTQEGIKEAQKRISAAQSSPK